MGVIRPELVARLYPKVHPHTYEPHFLDNYVGWIDHCGSMIRNIAQAIRADDYKEEYIERLKPEYRQVTVENLLRIYETHNKFLNKLSGLAAETKQPEITAEEVKEALEPIYRMSNPENERAAKTRAQIEEIFEALELPLDKGAERFIRPEGKGEKDVPPRS